MKSISSSSTAMEWDGMHFLLSIWMKAGAASRTLVRQMPLLLIGHLVLAQIICQAFQANNSNWPNSFTTFLFCVIKMSTHLFCVQPICCFLLLLISVNNASPPASPSSPHQSASDGIDMMGGTTEIEGAGTFPTISRVTEIEEVPDDGIEEGEGQMHQLPVYIMEGGQQQQSQNDGQQMDEGIRAYNTIWHQWWKEAHEHLVNDKWHREGYSWLNDLLVLTGIHKPKEENAQKSIMLVARRKQLGEEEMKKVLTRMITADWECGKYAKKDWNSRWRHSYKLDKDQFRKAIEKNCQEWEVAAHRVFAFAQMIEMTKGEMTTFKHDPKLLLKSLTLQPILVVYELAEWDLQHAKKPEIGIMKTAEGFRVFLQIAFRIYANMHKAKKGEPAIPKWSVKWTNQDDFERLARWKNLYRKLLGLPTKLLGLAFTGKMPKYLCQTEKVFLRKRRDFTGNCEEEYKRIVLDEEVILGRKNVEEERNWNIVKFDDKMANEERECFREYLEEWKVAMAQLKPVAHLDDVKKIITESKKVVEEISKMKWKKKCEKVKEEKGYPDWDSPKNNSPWPSEGENAGTEMLREIERHRQQQQPSEPETPERMPLRPSIRSSMTDQQMQTEDMPISPHRDFRPNLATESSPHLSPIWEEYPYPYTESSSSVSWHTPMSGHKLDDSDGGNDIGESSQHAAIHHHQIRHPTSETEFPKRSMKLFELLNYWPSP